MQLPLLAAALLMLTTSSDQLQVDNLEDVLVYPLEAPTNIHKREVPSIRARDDHDAFVEEKLIQHSQALEHLLKMLSTTSIIARRLMEHCIRTIEKPSMPEVVKFTRRSSDGQIVSVPSIKPMSQSPWCSLTILCHRSVDPVCAFDENFGYGRFYDICHMFQVNCYWKYNFSIVKNCKPNLL